MLLQAKWRCSRLIQRIRARAPPPPPERSDRSRHAAWAVVRRPVLCPLPQPSGACITCRGMATTVLGDDEMGVWWLDVLFDSGERHCLSLDFLRLHLLPLTAISSVAALRDIGRPKLHDRDALRTEIERYGGTWSCAQTKDQLAQQLWQLLHPSSTPSPSPPPPLQPACATPHPRADLWAPTPPPPFSPAPSTLPVLGFRPPLPPSPLIALAVHKRAMSMAIANVMLKPATKPSKSWYRARDATLAPLVCT